MGRKIVLLSDGTGNSSAKVWRTNVWRVFERLDLAQSDQVAFYDDGVGTAAFKPIALLGGAFGYGLKRNVIDLYKFACRNYRNDDDEIYAFGFSRGAFTIRTVIGLIATEGLVEAKSEPELHKKAIAVYRAFRAANFHTKWPRPLRPERWARALRDLLIRDTRSHRRNANIRFLGLWDTVAAYGMPIEEMTVGISNWVWPLMLPDYRLGASVQRACHALAIDDERTTFHPVLWDERNEAPLQPDNNGCRYLHNERISQVWFSGMHSNVGGGYPDDSLAQIPLTWIMHEAKKCGLRFKEDIAASPQTYGYPQTAQDRDGRIYDPRQGLGGYYRFGPRDIVALGGTMLARGGNAALPRIHESVLRRIANRAHAYAPIGLPANYEVVRENGGDYEVVPLEQAGHEQSAGAAARCHEQQRAWNIVWWRRGLYFLTVGVTLYLFAFPLLREAPAQDEFRTRIGWVSETLRLMERFLPAAAGPWFDGYARRPAHFLLIAVLLGGLLLLSTRLAARTQSRMDLAWQQSLKRDGKDSGPPTDLLYRFRTSRAYVDGHRWVKWRFAPAVFAILFVYLGLAFASHFAFNVQDYAGWVCKETGTRHQLAPGEIMLKNTTAPFPIQSESQKRDPIAYLRGRNAALLEFSPAQPCQSMGVLLQSGRKYLITFDSTETFQDWSGLRAPYGYYSTAVIGVGPKTLRPSSFQQTVNLALLPLRRELKYPWFQVVARVGATGGETSVLTPDFTEFKYKINVPFTPQRDGELFLFMNSPVIGVPGLYKVFYRHNKGSARVLITQCGGGEKALC